ncbi:MAG: ADP-forming succinate--CoA ligase subunit beta [Deltaproteobacteria bacterium]|nr:ADP-forming succinate--CoA ligase subunit beta [Deltaproteobacteria bacterium]
MNIHEYQAKEVLRRYKVNVPRGKVAVTAAEAEAAARELGGKVCVVKAQVHAGGRGKGGGIKLAKSPAEAREIADKMIGMKLVTHQTGPEGKEVHRVLVEEGCDIARELYLGMVLDRAIGRLTMMASTEGGVEIEEVAARTPEKILKEVIDPAVGLQGYQARKLAFALGIPKESIGKAVAFMTGLYKAFVESDCSLAEINPLVLTRQGDLLALDCKMGFDDNALYRHADIREMRDFAEEDPREVEAARFDLSYIGLDGDIACMVNGAGLAMATMDIIKFYGGSPANFLDVGGGATTEKVTAAFKILLADRNVKAILVNIFGGIMRCDVVASGIVEAAKQVKLSVPLVVRLEGTNVDLGRKILSESGLDITPGENMADAAERVVRLAGGAAR